MNQKDFDFPLPESLIALQPSPNRDESRLLVLNRKGVIEHRVFHNIVEYLEPGDMLLLNKTKVLPARVEAVKPNRARLDILLVKEIEQGTWEILSVGKYTGSANISGRGADIKDGRLLKFDGTREELLSSGEMPIPPYIKRKPSEEDKIRYQTVFAQVEGSIAAPTAGLHFTEGLINKIKAKGVIVRHLVLHVGKGTFAPIRTEVIEEHKMEPEYFEITRTLIEEILITRKSGGRLVSVGTTSTRAIESVACGRFEDMSDDNETIKGTTDIFIYPGHEFKLADALLTNFHLPGSTPLMLASAFAGREQILDAYRVAAGMNYRFFSYGDAMLIV